MDKDKSMSSMGHMELLGELFFFFFTFLQLDSLATVHKVDFPFVAQKHTNVIFRLNMTVTLFPWRLSRPGILQLT